MIMIMDFDVTHSMQIVILDANSVGLSRHPHIVLTRVFCARALRGIHVTDKAFGLVISRSRVQILLQATLRNNLRQVVHTYVPL